MSHYPLYQPNSTVNTPIVCSASNAGGDADQRHNSPAPHSAAHNHSQHNTALMQCNHHRPPATRSQSPTNGWLENMPYIVLQLQHDHRVAAEGHCMMQWPSGPRLVMHWCLCDAHNPVHNLSEHDTTQAMSALGHAPPSGHRTRHVTTTNINAESFPL